jgi:hypothetical protein
MRWRILAVLSVFAVGASAGAQQKSIGTIAFGSETFQILYAAAHKDAAMGYVDLEFFNKALPKGETFFDLDSDQTAELRGMRLRISEDPAYKNGTWVHPSIGGQDKFYYFDENDPIALSYKSTKDRISGSIEGTDTIGGTPVEVHLTFDLPIVLDEG